MASLRQSARRSPSIPANRCGSVLAHPAISPGGDRVAFAHGTTDQGNSFNLDVYFQVIGSDDDPVRITTNSRDDFSPTWSPDGNYLAFLRGYPGKAEIIRIPSIGGPIITLAAGTSGRSEKMGTTIDLYCVKSRSMHC